MDNTILLLDQHEMDSSVDIDERNSYYRRKAVRMVLSDLSGRIVLMYVKQKNYYKLPGGGVDEGEDLNKALYRELVEETGSKATVIEELGQVLEWRDFDKMKQTSYAYKVLLDGDPGEPNFTQSEIDEGFEVRWTDNLDEAIKLVEANLTHSDLDIVFTTIRDVAILRSAM